MNNENRIAVIGMGGLFPDAENLDVFWQNILSKRVSIRPVPKQILDAEIFFRPDLFQAIDKQDKSITKLAGLIGNFDFDATRKYRIPPSVTEHMDNNQHAALYTADQALKMNNLEGVSKERIAVIFGNGMIGEQCTLAEHRCFYKKTAHYLRQDKSFSKKLSVAEQDAVLERLSELTISDTLPITVDSAPGILPNLVAARVANVFDFHGPAFTVDAACASALASVTIAISGLQSGEYDAVICGASDLYLRMVGFMLFSAMNALSPDGSFPFDARANGFVIGQGAGTLILKRLPDAIESGNTIYAVITGYGQVSDGKGKYIAAPNEVWQAKAITDACLMAGYPVETIEMIEAHGTGTSVGDVVEIAGLKRSFKELGYKGKKFCGIGSVKSNIGHLKSAAGIAGLLKAILALHHQTLPPTANIETINPKLELDGSPFYVLQEARKWLARREHPRRVNVSAFGFGGADYHIALEEYREENYRQKIFTAGSVKSVQVKPSHIAVSGPVPVLFGGKNQDSVISQVKSLVDFLKSKSQAELHEAVAAHNYRADSNTQFRLAFMASSAGEIESKIKEFQRITHEMGAKASQYLTVKGIFYADGPGCDPEKIALLFPGQGAQYPDMLQQLRRNYPVMDNKFAEVDAFWTANYGHDISGLISSENQGIEETSKNLGKTSNTHPSVFAASLAMFYLLEHMGLRADYMLGHSLGELSALTASGKIGFRDGLFLVGTRGYAFDEVKLTDKGKMLALKSTREETEKLIAMSGQPVTVANVNSYSQIVVSGTQEVIEKFSSFLADKDIKSKILNVSFAFHSSLTAPVADLFLKKIRHIRFRSTSIKVMANHLGKFYDEALEEKPDLGLLLADQIRFSVDFVRSIRALYEAGVRLFIEVGPNSILTNLCKDILNDKEDVSILASNYRNSNEIDAFNRLVCALFAQGVCLSIPPVSGLIMPAAQEPESDTKDRDDLSGWSTSVSPIKNWTGDDVEIAYSGVAVGLPGSYKNSFRDDNFDQLFEGRNQIERLTDQEKQKLVDLHISKLTKNESSPSFKILSSINEVIQLAGKIGKLDIIRDYSVDEEEAKTMTSCVAHAVAAGYEALRDAQIPLVREYFKTAAGTYLPGKLTLPQEMQDETGVFFANGFPMVNPVIQEVSRYVAHQYGSALLDELNSFYESIISQVSDSNTKKLLTDWFVLNYSRLTDRPGESAVYEFNHRFMTEISYQANNRLSSMINARGPNLQLNAACSSTCVAVTLAEELIRSGRVKRMIIIGSDDASSKTDMPLIGAGFLCTGAATNEGDLYKAALPFDKRRNGMIIGAGAIGLVIEAEDEIKHRGVVPICRLLGSHAFNTAGHPSRIESDRFSQELDRFMRKMEEKHSLSRQTIAPKMLYVSHETYTPPQGGCSQTEVCALKSAFGEDFKKILITNTKGLTGHAMGASLEDAVAAKCLQYQMSPPVVNLRELDPELKSIKLSKGGHCNCEYALKMSAGFGSQGSYILLKRVAEGDQRISDRKRYESWLRAVSGNDNPELHLAGRLLTVKDDGLGTTRSIQVKPQHQEVRIDSPLPKSDLKKDATPTSRKKVIAEILQVFSEVTKYPVEMLELDMEMEADLGIDTVKQATVLAMLSEKYGFDQEEGFQLSNYPTIEHIVNLFLQKAENTDNSSSPEVSKISQSKMDRQAPDNFDKGGITAEVLNVFSEVTKYPVEMLELDMEMEADLGIDTVKQATVLAMLAEKYEFDQEEGFQLSNYPTVEHIVNLVLERNGQKKEKVPTTKDAAKNADMGPSADTQVSSGKLTRQIVVLVEEEPEAEEFELIDKLVLLIGEKQSLLDALVPALEKKGAKVEVLSLLKCDSPKKVVEAFTTQIPDKHIDVILDYTHAGLSLRFDEFNPGEARLHLTKVGEARFALFKKLLDSDPIPQRILCVVSIDGGFGFIKDANVPIDPSFGALTGFYKGLRKEIPASSVKILDLSTDELNTEPAQSVERILSELVRGSKSFEVGYSNNRRLVTKIEERELNPNNFTDLPDHATLLVTGGARGITAKAMLKLAGKYPFNFVVIGRTLLPENIEELTALDNAGLNKLRKEIHERLKQSKQRVTPVMLDSEFRKITKAIEIKRNLDLVHGLGNKVVYYSCDVSEYDELEAVLTKARAEFGTIHGIIHGAGIEKSHLLGKKSQREFREVFDVKAMGAYNLQYICKDDPIKVVFAFTSISGRFGNAAQIDYCAGNSFLDYWIKSIRANSGDIHAKSIVWSGWRDIGMAWENDLVREHAEDNGLGLINPNDGAEAFLHEFEHCSPDSEIILSRGLGDILEPGMSVGGISDLPWVERVTREKGQVKRTYKTLSANRDAFMDQHRLGGIPILPAVGSMELFAEYFLLQEGRKSHYIFRDLAFKNPVKLFHGRSREVYIEGNKIDNDMWEVSLWSKFRPKNSDMVQQIQHSSGKICCAPPDYGDIHPSGLRDDKSDLKTPSLNDLHAIKFEITISPGLLYQDLEASFGRSLYIGERGVIYPYELSDEQLTNNRYPLQQLIINPCFVDAVFQGSALYGIYNEHRTYLPWTVEEFAILKVPRRKGPYTVYAEIVRREEEKLFFNVTLVDQNQELYYYAKKVCMHRINL